MMNFVLVPFLLAAHVLPNQDGWINGPEYTFNAHVGTIFAQEKSNLRGNSLVCKLICRPEEPDNLICRIEETKSTRLSPSAFNSEQTKPAYDAIFDPFKYDSTPFQIKFDKNGIDSYVIENDDDPRAEFQLNMNRMIANQLSIGTDLRGQGNSYRTMENFTIGECITNYTIKRERITTGESRRTFALMSLNDLEIRENELIDIVRKRHMAECPTSYDYSLGTRNLYGIVPRNSIEEMESSATRMQITKDSFTAETVNVLYLYDLHKQKLGKILDHIYLSLESIEPATSKLQSINNPISVGLMRSRILMNARNITRYFMA